MLSVQLDNSDLHPMPPSIHDKLDDIRFPIIYNFLGSTFLAPFLVQYFSLRINTSSSP